LEEYPSDGPIDRILNGHMTAAFAIWEYWRATGSLKALDLLTAAAEAVKHYGPLFRVPGEVSFYGLRFKAQHGRYHLAHIAELHTLAQITRDSFFDRLADAFASDTPWLLGH
jgi:D-glucuronyl C5-epimerase C-terminus